MLVCNPENLPRVNPPTHQEPVYQVKFRDGFWGGTWTDASKEKFDAMREYVGPDGVNPYQFRILYSEPVTKAKDETDPF